MKPTAAPLRATVTLTGDVALSAAYRLGRCADESVSEEIVSVAGIAVRICAVLALLGALSCESRSGGAAFTSPSPSGQSKWGPLAVVDNPSPNAWMEALLGGGELVIGERCVTVHYDSSRGVVTDCDGCTPRPVEYPARDVLLVWRSGEAKWDADRREVAFTDFKLGEVRLGDGDHVDFGGGFLSVREPDWLERPDASCRGMEAFEVNSIAG